MLKGKLLTFILGLTLISVALLAPISAVPMFTIRGYVKTWKGEPHTNTIVVVFDIANYEVRGVTKTNASGYFEITVPRGYKYVVFILPLNANGTALSHVPEIADLRSFEDLVEVTINFKVYPAAFVKVYGTIHYVGGEWLEYYSLAIVDTSGKKLSEVIDAGTILYTREFVGKGKAKASIVDEYGTASSFLVYYEVGVRRGKLPAGLADKSIAIVPAEKPVIVEFTTSIIDNRKPPFLREPVHKVKFTIGDPLNPLTLAPGKKVVFDIEKESLKRIIQEVRRDVDIAESLIEEMERMGFYLAPERADLAKAVALIEEAKLAYEQNQPVEQIIEKLERAYVIATQIVAGRVFFLKTVALEGAPLLSYFIALFAAVMAYYFFEDPKKKLYSFIGFFAVFMVIFALSYPGFPLLWNNRRDLFLLSVSTAFLGVLFLLFYLPIKIREAELPGKFRRGAIIAVTFSLAKRFSRLKKTRTGIVVFSLAALIWAFTVLASISTVYGIWSAEVPSVTEVNALVVKHLINETTISSLGYFSDYQWFVQQLGNDSVSVVVYNDPTIKLTILITSPEGKSIEVKTFMGVSETEDRVTGISKIIVKGEWSKIKEKNSVFLPSALAKKLGVKVGDVVKIEVYRPGVEIPVSEKYVVAGIFDELVLDRIKDIDGTPLKPLVLVKGDFAPANSTDIIIGNWEHLLKEVLLEEKAIFSTVFKIYRIAAVGSPDVLKSIARRYIERKGEGYYVYVNTEGKCYKLFFGQKVENILMRNVDFIIPIAIVISVVLVSMYSIVEERKREIFIFNAIGFNPMHIAFLFLAESIVYGLISGGLGYIAGIVTFRVMATYFSSLNLLVREKLEWYWSIIAIFISVLVAMIASFKPALKAAMMYTPSRVRRIKATEAEKLKREEKILVTYVGKRYLLSAKIKEDEAIIFFSFIYSRLKDMESGYTERVEDLQEYDEEELPDGTLVKRFTFKCVLLVEGERVVIDNDLRCTKSPREKFYRVELYAKPHGEKEIPLRYLDRVASMVNDILKSWEEEKKRLLTSRR